MAFCLVVCTVASFCVAAVNLIIATFSFGGVCLQRLSLTYAQRFRYFIHVTHISCPRKKREWVILPGLVAQLLGTTPTKKAERGEFSAWFGNLNFIRQNGATEAEEKEIQ